MKKLLFLGASRYYQKSIEAIREYGYKVYVIDRNPNSPGFKVADEYAVIDISDEERACKFAEEKQVDGVFAVNDFGVRTAAYISEKLGLPGISYESALIATDKALMRERWAKSGVPVPPFRVITALKEAREFAHEIGFPIILKPADSRGGGSRGVKVVFNEEELEDSLVFAQSFYDDKRVVMERCVFGSEHSLEVVILNGNANIIAISEKEKTPYPYRVDRKVIYPARISPRGNGLMEEAVRRAIESVGILNGVAHVELALTSDGPILFELGARCGGGATPQIVEEYTGIPYLKLAVKLCLGEEISSEELKAKFEKGAVYHFFTFKPGRVKRILGMECLRSAKEVKDFELFFKPGDSLREVRVGGDRHGFAVIIANTREEAIGISKKIDKIVKVEYEL